MKASGFTLVEMVIVLVMIGLIVTVAVPRLAKAYRERATALAADEFVLTHSLASSAAVRYGRLAELHINAASRKVWVEVDTSGTGVVDTVGRVKTLGNTNMAIATTRSLLCFDARGFPSIRGPCQAPDATLYFSMSGNADTVKITALGKVLR